MHRIPLQIAQPSITWNRNAAEAILFEHTLNKANVEETVNFLTIIEEETRTYVKNSYGIAVEQMERVQCLIKSKNRSEYLEGIRLLNTIILRAPKDSTVLASALKIRGNCYFQQCSFEGASSDFEMFLHVHPNPAAYEELCEINGNLVICFYIMRQYERTKLYLQFYKIYKEKISKDWLRISSQLAKVDLHITQFVNELDNIEDVVPKFSEDVNFSIPFKGFNTSQDIPLSSAACCFNTTISNAGVYTNCNIPSDSVVLVEHPILQSVNTPFVQCELCLRQHKHVYTCLECRYKTYCSIKCMQKDRLVHSNECMGYKNLTLLILDAGNLFRIFIRISTMLHEYIFTFKEFCKLTLASDVLEKIEAIIEEKDIPGVQYLKLLKTKPDYVKLTNMQYATLVATAFRLTIYIEKNTLAIETFYKRLNISNKQKMIVVGALLMRLNCHLLANTFDFEYVYPLDSTKPDVTDNVHKEVEEMAAYVKPVRDSVIDDIDVFYKINTDIDIKRRTAELLQSKLCEGITRNALPNFEHTESCNRIQRLLSTYKDNITELYFNPDSVDFFLYGETASVPTTQTAAQLICVRISEMCDMERCLFVQKFARYFHKYFADYFLLSFMRHKCMQQILALLCTTLSKFRHSCVPNVEVVVLENGVVLGKTLRDISRGEELLVSFKANYMRHTRVERNIYLKQLDIACDCKYCNMPEVDEPTNQRLGIKCNNCNSIEITPANGKCSNCRSNYNTLLTKYRKEIKLLEDNIDRKLNSNVDDRELYVLHAILYKYVQQYLLPYNELRIRAELKYAKFLALKNFAQQAYNVLMEIKANILCNYHESIIWFTFYAKMLQIIKIILHYNLNEGLYALSTSCLQQLCKLGLHIIDGQKEHLHLFETYDYESATTLNDLRTFLQWKEKVLCSDLEPLSDSFKHNAEQQSNTNCEYDILPVLSKETY